MEFKVLNPEDIDGIIAIQPIDWGNITVPVSYYFDSPFCFPIKLQENGQMIGMGCTIYHQDTVWLAHIIVHADHRNKGLGKMITQTLIDSINRSRYKTIYLIATDLGAPVYSSLGFITECNYSFYKDGSNQFEIHPSVVLANSDLYEQILALDYKASGEERSGILSEHLKNTMVFLNNNTVEGFYMPSNRDGLIIASNAGAGLELMKLRLQSSNLAIIPEENTMGIDFLLANNFNFFRKAKRMRLGEERKWEPTYNYNRMSGQFG